MTTASWIIVRCIAVGLTAFVLWLKLVRYLTKWLELGVDGANIVAVIGTIAVIIAVIGVTINESCEYEQWRQRQRDKK